MTCWRSVAWVVCVFAALSSAGTAWAKPAAGPAASSVELSRVTFVSTKKGARDVLVRAKHASLDPLTDVVALEGVEVEATPNGQAGGFLLQCDRGKLELDASNFYMEGHVRGRTSDGREVETTWARYDRATGVVSTDAPVVLRDGNDVLRGGGFRYRVEDDVLQLIKGAQMVQGSDAREVAK